MKDNYDDIIELAHHQSKNHPHMSMRDRAAQFSPFAALAGHDAAIRETERVTDSFGDQDEGQKERLDRKLRFLLERAGELPWVEVRYFQPDERKDGGRYLLVRGRIRKVDSSVRKLILDTREGEEYGGMESIPLDGIVELRSPLLQED